MIVYTQLKFCNTDRSCGLSSSGPIVAPARQATDRRTSWEHRLLLGGPAKSSCSTSTSASKICLYDEFMRGSRLLLQWAAQTSRHQLQQVSPMRHAAISDGVQQCAGYGADVQYACRTLLQPARDLSCAASSKPCQNFKVKICSIESNQGCAACMSHHAFNWGMKHARHSPLHL